MNTESDASSTIPLSEPAAWPLLMGLGCVRALSALPQAVWPVTSRVLGSLLWRLARRRRRVVEINLGLAFPEASAQERANMGQACFNQFVLSIIEVGRLWFGDAKFVESRVELRGLEQLQAVNRAHAVLLTAPHFFAVELVGVAIALQRPLSAVYARAKNPYFERFELGKRLRFLEAMIERQQTVRMVRALRAKTVIWWLPDHAVGASRGAIESCFFGQRVLSSRASAWFLARENVKLVPVSIVRAPDGHIVATVQAPLDALRGDAGTVTAQLDAHFESEIRRQPSEYFWMHRRFKPVDATEHNPYREP
ncbi:MAG: hypothetical protein AAF499_19090 [Pseudomonadota bacterium]